MFPEKLDGLFYFKEHMRDGDRKLGVQVHEVQLLKCPERDFCVPDVLLDVGRDLLHEQFKNLLQVPVPEADVIVDEFRQEPLVGGRELLDFDSFELKSGLEEVDPELVEPDVPRVKCPFSVLTGRV